MAAIAYALSASLVYGLSDFLGGLKSRTCSLLGVLLVSQGAAFALLAAFVLLRGEGPPSGEFLLWAAAAGVAEAVGVAALYRGLAVGMMSVVAPVASTAPVVPIVAGISLGELPGALQWAGIALAVAGILIAGSASPGGGSTPETVRAGLIFGLLSAVGFGAFYVALDAASEGDIPWALVVARATAVALFVGAYAASRARPRIPRSEVPVLILIGVLIIAADSLYAVSSTKGLLGVVAVLSTLYPVVTIALARIFLGERLERAQQVGIVAVLGGVFAISAA
ncbi:MAG: EamA family transporter [Solirubrobacterales bacterium]